MSIILAIIVGCIKSLIASKVRNRTAMLNDFQYFFAYLDKNLMISPNLSANFHKPIIISTPVIKQFLSIKKSEGAWSWTFLEVKDFLFFNKNQNGPFTINGPFLVFL